VTWGDGRIRPVKRALSFSQPRWFASFPVR
jgi:hypothetical protein